MAEVTYNPSVTHDDLKAAQASLPEGLQSVTTAVTIKALMAYTEETSATVPVAIPDEDLEPLLTLGFVRLEHLEPLEDGGYRVVVERGEIRKSRDPG